MGSNQIKDSNNNNNNNNIYDKVSKHSFEYIQIIGRGGFGKVWKVLLKKNKKIYAMKEMSKAKIIDRRSERSVKSERELLSKMEHSFIINMHYSFQDLDNLYLVMDYLEGGDLRYHLCRRRYLTENQAKFFICCVILALEYIHSNNIIHRDLKPENLVLDDEGYIHLTDFGVAKIWRYNNFKDTSGTPGYMAPEVMCAQNHTIAVDYFALGVMGYEFIKGHRPYQGKSRKEIKEKILSKQIQIRKNDIPEGWSLEACDFVNRLIQRKPHHRLGNRGPKEVQMHPWFKGISWKDLYNHREMSPYIPKKKDNFDEKYCNQPDKTGIETEERYNSIIRRKDYHEIFNEYLYFNREENKARNDLFLIKNPHEQYKENIEDEDDNENDKNDIYNNESNNNNNETVETAYNKYSDEFFIF